MSTVRQYYRPPSRLSSRRLVRIIGNGPGAGDGDGDVTTRLETNLWIDSKDNLGMAYEIGDRVTVTKRVGAMLTPTVRKGTQGVVTKVSYAADVVTVTVGFVNGRVENLSLSQIRPS